MQEPPTALGAGWVAAPGSPDTAAVATAHSVGLAATAHSVGLAATHPSPELRVTNDTRPADTSPAAADSPGLMAPPVEPPHRKKTSIGLIIAIALPVALALGLMLTAVAGYLPPPAPSLRARRNRVEHCARAGLFLDTLRQTAVPVRRQKRRYLWLDGGQACVYIRWLAA